MQVWSAGERWSEVTVPPLILHGRLVPVENARILAARPPNATLCVFEGAGHRYRSELDVEDDRVVLAFVRRHA